MAAVAPAADQAKDLLQKLSLDSKNKTNEALEVTKNSGVHYGSTNNGEVTNASIPPREMSLTPLLEFMDGTMCYVPNGYTSTTYYYGGYDGPTEWEEYPRYVTEGVELPPPGVYGDMYHHGYGYAPYGPYPSPGSPVPTLGHDGQLYGPQHYQFPAPYYPPTSPANQPFTANQAPNSKGDVCTSVAADQTSVTVDSTKLSSNGVVKGNANGNNGSSKPKSSQQNSSLNSNSSFARGSLPGGLHPSSYQDPRFSFDAMWSPFPWFDGPMLGDGQQRPATSSALSSMTSHVNSNSSGRNQNMRPLPQVMGMHAPRPTPAMGTASPGMMNRMYPSNRIYGQNGNAFRSGLGFGSNGFDSRMNGRWGVAMDGKYKPRARNGLFSYKNENLDGLSELNRGPRAGRFRNQKGFGPTVTISVKGQSLPTVANVQDSSVVPDNDQYNQTDFPETYADAKFFVIKSYSEDDIHKSIKYKVWASTPNGNKKLDAAYEEAKERTGCPVFLFFSVNTSGQFVGVAEMVGPVDFNRTVEYWQQDKWTGCFPVKWHIVKDVPNSILKHITLENNDNKPVTNSRDTQEVKLDQGLQMLKLFKEHASKTSILDDFSFYETRQKVMQEKKSKQQQLHKKVLDGKTVDVNEKHQEGQNGKPKLQMPSEVTVLKKETGQVVVGERLLSEENGVAAVASVTPKELKPATEKRVLANGVASG